jgi:hypothetical protein
MDRSSKRLLVISVKGFLGKDFVGHVGKGILQKALPR